MFGAKGIFLFWFSLTSFIFHSLSLGTYSLVWNRSFSLVSYRFSLDKNVKNVKKTFKKWSLRPQLFYVKSYWLLPLRLYLLNPPWLVLCVESVQKVFLWGSFFDEGRGQVGKSTCLDAIYHQPSFCNKGRYTRRCSVSRIRIFVHR